MFCLYLRGQSTFWGYFFTGCALSYRPFGFWCHFGPKWPFWRSASMEVSWPQSLETFKSISKKCQHGELLVLISQQGPEILSSLHFVPYWGSASIKALVPKSLKTSEVCLKSAQLAKQWCQSVKRVLSNWAASVLQCFVYISEANQLFEVISSQVVHFPIGLLGFGAILTPNGHFEDCPP